MSTTDQSPWESKLRERLTAAHLVVARAENHCRLYPGAQATPLIRDMKTALTGLIEEIKRR